MSNSMVFAHTSSTHAPVPEIPDNDYRDAFEATIEHYIQSFLQMNHPRVETRIQSKNLQQQWRRLCRGRRWIDPQGDFFMLERHHILDHQLAPDFVTRLNMASLAHELLTPSLDRTRCIRGLEGMRTIFLPDVAQLSDEPRWPIREIFLQLVVITLVLQARHIESSESVSMVSLLSACDSSIVPDLTLLVNTNITELLSLAERVSSEEGKLEALESDTMIKTIAQMKALHQTLTVPVCQSLVEDLNQTRYKEMEELYRDIPKASLELGENEIWLQDDAYEDSQDTDADLRDASPDPEIKPSLYQAKSSGNSRSSSSVIDLVEIMDTDHDTSTQQTECVQGTGVEDYMAANSELSKKPDRPHRPFFRLPRLQSFFDGQEAPLFATGSEHLSNCEAGTSVHKAIKQLGTMTSSNVVLESIHRRIGDQSGSHPESIIVEDEDDDAYLTDTSEVVRAGPESRNDCGSRTTWWSALSSSSPALRPRTSATPATAARRRTRHWSKEEEDRLMKYVPFFRYAPQEIHRMKRKMEVKWSDLKEYDMQHGNVLRDRTQVMLKDKFRELKKKGRI
ncbi:hypothetical protein EC968_004538 [Mortierella alpina]|nr:hypothetical protein EC968_004538 [Mortierella alpina]